MKLYRGVKQEPEFYTPEAKAEHKVLLKQMAEMEERGTGKLEILIFAARNRIDHCGKLAVPQHFTDNLKIALDCAGKDGYIIMIDVPNNIAHSHYDGEQLVRGAMENISSNFVFAAEELAQNRQEWKLDVQPVILVQDHIKNRVATVYNEQELALKLKNLKPKDVIVSTSGTRRTVLAIDGDKILFEELKVGKVSRPMYRRTEFFASTDWIQSIEIA